MAGGSSTLTWAGATSLAQQYQSVIAIQVHGIGTAFHVTVTHPQNSKDTAT
jgi:hypothetical protein